MANIPTYPRLHCYFGCEEVGPLHRFPKPHINPERFAEWKAVLCEETREKGDMYIHNTFKLCNKHFENYYVLESKQLTRNSVPTLFLEFNRQADSRLDLLQPAVVVYTTPHPEPSTSTDFVQTNKLSQKKKSMQAMEEYMWQCCRFCLSVQTLNPIFRDIKHAENYISTIYEATGIMVRVNDSFPKQICSSCVTFINKSIKFRRKCAEIQKKFENKVNIMEIDTMGSSDPTSIDVSHLIDDQFTEYDDNITLDAFQYGDAHTMNDQTNIDGKKFNVEDRVQNISIDVKIEKTELTIDESPEDTINVKDCGDDKVVNDNKSKRRPKRKPKDSIREDSKAGDNKKDKIKEEIECEYCHKILTSKLSLRNHNKIHTGFDIVCEHCGKKFITRRLLLMHCRAKHGYEKTDKCSYCDYRASNAEQVKIHERIHTGEKPFVCAECNAGFHRKSSYLQHVAIHLPDKTVQCEQCPARFKSVTLMRIHLSRHRAPRYTFACALCGGTFARRRNVARHLARVHSDRADHHIQRRAAC